jgi:hypothetical protein
MKSVRRIVLVLAAFACSQDSAWRLPVAPAPQVPVPPNQPSASLGTVWMLVLGESGVCVDSATATVLRGQGVGQSVRQVTPCGAWDYGGGILFRDLRPGVTMTLRVSAPGYVAQEVTVLPLSGTYTAWEIYPTRIP